jgi:hypothetical protein
MMPLAGLLLLGIKGSGMNSTAIICEFAEQINDKICYDI